MQLPPSSSADVCVCLCVCPGWTPLHEACIHGWWSVARALLAAGADVSRPGLERVTPLHDAAGNGRRRLVRLLLRHGAEPAARTARGQLPADLASEPRVRALLERAAADPAAAAAASDSSDDTGEWAATTPVSGGGEGGGEVTQARS